jgi:hypothetical protein
MGFNGLDGFFRHPHLKQIDQIAFYSSAVNTRTRGIDLVVNSIWSINKDILRIILAANINRTRIYGVIQSAANLPADSLVNADLAGNFQSPVSGNALAITRIFIWDK